MKMESVFFYMEMDVTREYHINKLNVPKTNIRCFPSFVAPRFYVDI